MSVVPALRYSFFNLMVAQKMARTRRTYIMCSLVFFYSSKYKPKHRILTTRPNINRLAIWLFFQNFWWQVSRRPSKTCGKSFLLIICLVYPILTKPCLLVTLNLDSQTKICKFDCSPLALACQQEVFRLKIEAASAQKKRK